MKALALSVVVLLSGCTVTVALPDWASAKPAPVVKPKYTKQELENGQHLDVVCIKGDLYLIDLTIDQVWPLTGMSCFEGRKT